MLVNPHKSDVAAREEATLAWWGEREIFKKSIEKPAPLGDYVFYDGPPFATGLPHYGHIVASVIKDVVPRYFTMRGYRVPRVWGWDCHGLPIENIVEKELGFRHKKDIVAMGVGKFNELCRSKVLTYADEWKKVIPRIGRWADMEKPYFTMNRDFMESVWWVFKQLWDKGLVYEDYRSMHICPRCETTLSQQEVSEGYKDVKDISVTVKFKLKLGQKILGKDAGDNTYLLAWTTTPWTLPGNVALAVGADITYVAIVRESEVLIISKQLWEQKWKSGEFGEFGNFIKEVKGRDLVGLAYEPPFDYYIKDEKLKNRENGWKVYAADFITTDAGTGIAHEAPAFGADDWELAKKEKLPFVQHVGADGTFRPEVVDFAGMEVKPNSADDKVRLGTDIAVLKYLQEHGTFFSKENITHSYPHCWRCDTPLLNYATSSWFVKVEAQKDALLKNARDINWSPEHIKTGRWGKWLEGARDWSISRQRFWASVMPIWKCEKCKTARVFGSAAELEEASGKKVEDLHKHVVDEIVFTCWQCDGEMRRIPDVLDTWFDSGSMPYGQAHYPFENKQSFDTTFPAQFIAEGQDQTRAWFYYLHTLSTSVFGKPAFQNVVVNGIVLAEDGKKMSKRLNNYPDPMGVVEKYGADALRFYLLASPVVAAENLNFTERGVDEALKKHIQRLQNVLAFYRLYADGTVRDWKSDHILDAWIIARLDNLLREVTAAFDSYQLDGATRPIAGFIDDLSVWYLRRSRERFKEDGADKKAALATLRFVLHRLALIIAPATPFLAEHLFQAVREGEDEESVHLAAWPHVSYQPSFWGRLFGRDESRLALETMQVARNVVSSALDERDKAGIKVRQPLQTLEIPVPLAQSYLDMIADELNVKRVVVTPNALRLDTTITDELREEGFVRETIRAIQAYRKESGLSPGEKSTYALSSASDDEKRIVEKHRARIEKATSTTVVFSD
jgi:isoleucyl-tRNA synthetase